MAGIPPNVIPANTDDIANNLVSGISTEAQEVVAGAVTEAVSSLTGVTSTVQETLAQAQAKATEQLNSLSQQLKLPPDAIAALPILSTIFSYEQLSNLSIEDIKKRINSIKLTFSLSRPNLPEIPELPIPSVADIIDNAIPNLPNETGLDAYGEQILDRIKQLRQEAQSKFEVESANRAKNMFQLRQDLVQAQSQKLLSTFLEKANIQVPPVI